MKKSDQKLTIIYLILDIFLINLSIILSLYVKYGNNLFNPRYRLFYIIYNIVWLITAFVRRSYAMHWRHELKDEFYIQLKVFLFHIGIISFMLIFLKAGDFSRGVIYGSTLIFFLLRLAAGFILKYFVYFLRRKGKNLKKILIIGAGRVGRELRTFFLGHKELGYKTIGFLDDFVDSNEKIDISDQIIGKVKDLNNILESLTLDEVIITLPISESKKIEKILMSCDYYGVRTRFVPDYYKLIGRKYSVSYFGYMTVLNIREVPLDDILNYSLKRIFDVLFSLVVLVLLFPFYIGFGIAIILESKGPALYKPVRLGMHGKKFKLYKFRSMYDNDDPMGGKKSTEKNDQRLTRIGKIIRKYNIDELPQFLNVLKGDMSVVGPRPHRIWLNRKMQDTLYYYMIRHYIKPGITGWAQVNGWRGPSEDTESIVQRTKHDIWYMENWSFIFDLRIIWLTLFGRKAHQNAF